MHFVTDERRQALHERMLEYYQSSQSYFDEVERIAGDRPSAEERTLFEALARLAPDQQGTARVLEMGCGRCESAPTLLAMLGGGSFAGIDASPQAVQRAREHLPRHDIRVGDIRSLPFDDSSFDVVVLNYVLEHTCEPNRVVSEALRVLRPGGLLGMIVPVMDIVWMMPSSLRHRARNLKFLAGYTAQRWLHFLRLRYDARYFAFPLVEQPVVFESSHGQFMPDDDQVYLGSTLEVEKFLRANGCEIAYSTGRDIKTYVRNGRRPWVDMARTAVFGLVRASLKISEWEQFTTTRTWVARKL